MITLIIKIAITMLLCGRLLYLGMKALAGDKPMPNGERALLAIGLAPALISLVLYYLLMVLPHQAHAFYFWLILGVFLLFAFSKGIKLQNIAAPFHWVKCGVDLEIQLWKSFKFNRAGLATLANSKLLVMVLLCIFCMKWWLGASTRSILEHDTLEYGTLARWFYDAKEITYQTHRYNAETGFYYVGLHGFGFQLLGTWEQLVNAATGLKGDTLFKFFTSYYGSLTFVSLWYYIRRAGQSLGILALIFLGGTTGITILLRNFHLDTFRIWLVSMMFVMVARSIHSGERKWVYLAGVLAGLSAFAHSIGAIIAAIAGFVLILFLPGHLIKKRLPAVLIFTALVMLSGGVHYVLDVAFGTGWIFKGVNFF